MEKICINKIRTMNMAYVPDCELVHRNCDGKNENCDGYKAYDPKYQIPINQGKVACEMMKEGWSGKLETMEEEFNLKSFGMGF